MVAVPFPRRRRSKRRRKRRRSKRRKITIRRNLYGHTGPCPVIFPTKKALICFTMKCVS